MSTKRFLSVFVVSLMMFASLATIQRPAVAAASNHINVWWPVTGAHITGAQPFKALLENADVQNYQMFWQVDGGSWVWMNSNSADYPHKEAVVDVTNWSWHGPGPYHVNFIARDLNGTVVAQQAVDIYVGSNVSYGADRSVTPSPTPTATAKATPTPTPVTIIVTPTPVPLSTPSPTPLVTPVPPPVSANPLANARLYVNPYSDPAQWIKNNPGNSDSALMAKIANQSESEWFGDWNSNVYNDAKNTTATVTANGSTPVYVIYDIPHRDCGSYSAGGAANATAYRTWINNLVAGIGGKKAVALLEPDALAGMDCLNSADQAERTSLIKETVSTLESHGIATYIDAGNPNWISADTMASRLKAAGIDQSHGFALNISNFYSTSSNVAYGTQLVSKLAALGSPNKHFVIDTSRNGSGPSPDYQWCNPPGRSLGQQPTTNTGNPLVDAYLWVKGPGGSDGACGNGAPSAGVFWPSYAIDLARNTSW